MTGNRIGPLFLLAICLLLLTLLGPVAAMLATTSPAEVMHAFMAPVARNSLWVSVLASSIAISVASVLGVPAGYALAHARARVRGPLLFGLALPLAFPPVASGIILLHVIGTQSPLGGAFYAHGFSLVDSLPGIALAEFFVAGSFVAITSCAAFGALNPIYEESAATLGASQMTSFLKIALPLAAPNVAAGILLAWLRAIGEYGATSIVAYHPTSLPVALYVSLDAQGVGPALALSYGFVVLAAVVLGVQWALRRRVV
ncbi:MAG: ABC transporter permease subunit [Candidatus Eremiobacteraeota bacterium]|nr:ABC transporter permease subunit [Candidatus Eremiobacteraeota bacterium]